MGKPVWFYYCNLQKLVNFISLCDTGAGGGIQAIVSLSEEDMPIFENDEELLVFASVNPAPPWGVILGFLFYLFTMLLYLDKKRWASLVLGFAMYIWSNFINFLYKSVWKVTRAWVQIKLKILKSPEPAMSHEQYLL